ncbi:hypothetical protein TcCL_Unassigned04487, partial [Trypanosoma cruzi]
MTPRAGSALTHGGHRAAASAGPKRNTKRRHAVANKFFQSTVLLVISVCVCAEKAEKKRSTGRHIKTARGTAGWQRCMRHGPNIKNHARWQHTPNHRKETKRKTRRQGAAVCVALRVSASPGRIKTKQNKREGNVCAAPQALAARP